MGLILYALVVLLGLALSVHGLWIQRDALARAAPPPGWRHRFAPVWRQRRWFREEEGFLRLVKGFVLMDLGFTLVLIGVLARYAFGPMG